MAENRVSLVWPKAPVPQEYSGPPAKREHGRVLVQQRGPQGSASLTELLREQNRKDEGEASA